MCKYVIVINVIVRQDIDAGVDPEFGKEGVHFARKKKVIAIMATLYQMYLLLRSLFIAS